METLRRALILNMLFEVIKSVIRTTKIDMELNNADKRNDARLIGEEERSAERTVEQAWELYNRLKDEARESGGDEY